MAHFHYQALNAERRLVSGELSAETVAQAVAQLEAQGLVVQSIGYAPELSVNPILAEVSASASPVTPSPTPASVDESVERAALRSHLARVLERTRELAPAMQALAEELPAGHRRRQLMAVLDVLQRGDQAAAATALESLPEYWIPLLSAATASQDPGRVLRDFLDESQRAEDLRRQHWQALAYPLVVALLAAGVMTVLSFLVVPVFREMLIEFDIPLPRPTALVLSLATFISSGRVLIFLAVLVVVAWLLPKSLLLFPTELRDWWGDRFGTLWGRSNALARFAQFTADLLEARLDPPSALRVAGFTTRSPRLQRAAWRVARGIERNEGLTPLTRPEPLTHAVLHALRGNMPPETRVRLLRELSSCYAQKARAAVSWTSGWIEPIAICVIGLLVGGTVLALFLPLINLIHGLSGG